MEENQAKRKSLDKLSPDYSSVEPNSVAVANLYPENSKQLQQIMRTKSQESGVDIAESIEPRNFAVGQLEIDFKQQSAFEGEGEVLEQVCQVQDQSDEHIVMHRSQDLSGQGPPRGLTPEENLSPNELLFPERVKVDASLKNRNETVDSQYVLDKLEEADIIERQKQLQAAESVISMQSQVDSNKQGQNVKKFEVWEGNRNFWWGAKIQTGPDTKNLIIVIMLIQVTNAVSLSFSWIDYADSDGNYFPLIFGIVLWMIVNFCLYKAATSDPGLIPKQPEDEHTLKYRAMFKNYLVVDGLNGQKAFTMRLKFCFSCMIFRPKRAIHCRACDVCVEMFDHHCPFISNCVGKRNYVYFWFFINSLWVNVVYTIWLASHDIHRRKSDFQAEYDLGRSYGETFKELPLAPLAIAFCAFVLSILTVLVTYHYYLASTFQTTYEHRKGTYSRYWWRPLDSGSWLSNMRQRVFTKKSKKPIFRPMEDFNPLEQNFKPPELKTPQSLVDQSSRLITNGHLTEYSQQTFERGQPHMQQNELDQSGLLGLEQIRPQLDSEDFMSPQDSQAELSQNFESAKKIQGGQSPLELRQLQSKSVGPKTNLIGEGAGTMQARQLNSPSVLDSQDSNFVLSDFKQQERSNRKEHEPQFASRRKMIVPADSTSLIEDSRGKIVMEQSPQEKLRVSAQKRPNHDDLSRERRSPEEYHPPPERIESVEVNADITDPGDNQQSEVPFSPRLQNMQKVEAQHSIGVSHKRVLSGSQPAKPLAGKANRHSIFSDRRQLEKSFREVKVGGKLDQDVLSESQIMPQNDQDSNEESQDFDFDVQEDVNEVATNQPASHPVQEGNRLDGTSLKDILTQRAKTGFLK